MKVQYKFRGNVVATYDTENERNPLEIGRDAHMCSFIKEDTILLADFFNMCRQHQLGFRPTNKLVDVEVD